MFILCSLISDIYKYFYYLMPIIGVFYVPGCLYSFVLQFIIAHGSSTYLNSRQFNPWFFFGFFYSLVVFFFFWGGVLSLNYF